MHIDKQEILSMLQSKGQSDTAAQADAQLPAQVDTDAHAEILSKLGINPEDLQGIAGVAGKLGL